VSNGGSAPPNYVTRTNGVLHSSVDGGITWVEAMVIKSGTLNFEYSALIDLGYTASTHTHTLGLYAIIQYCPTYASITVVLITVAC
jgi:hypothetical protein